MSLDCLGANTEIGSEELGFDMGDVGSMFQAAGGLTTGIVSTVQKDQQEKKLAADEKAALDKAIAADVAAAAALARSDLAAQLVAGAGAKVTAAQKSAADLAKAAADSACDAQDRAAAKLSPEANEKRADAADVAKANAITAASTAPNDASKVALSKAWVTVANKAHSGAIVSSGKKDGGELVKAEKGGDGWLAGKIGPVPNKAIAGVGALGAAALIAKKVFHIF